MKNLNVENVEKNGVIVNKIPICVLLIVLIIVTAYMYFHRYEYKGSFVRTNIYTNEVEILCNERHKYSWVSEWPLGNKYSRCGSFEVK